MPDTIDVHIKNIQSKLQLLLKKHALLLKESENLKKENQDYKLKEKELKDENEQLTQQVHILKASASRLDGEEKAAFEKNINRYIRSLNKCIDILNK
jgi:hypothetical protein